MEGETHLDTFLCTYAHTPKPEYLLSIRLRCYPWIMTDYNISENGLSIHSFKLYNPTYLILKDFLVFAATSGRKHIPLPKCFVTVLKIPVSDLKWFEYLWIKY